MGNLDILVSHSKDMSIIEKEQLLVHSFQESQYLYLLVTNILSLTKLQSSNVQIKLQPYLVSELVEEIDMIFRTSPFKKRITVSSSVDLQFIHIDSKLILQALFNLIENAVKHTSTDTKINLSIRYASDEQIEFAVIDEGPGISIEEQQKIFEPFTQGQINILKITKKKAWD